MAVVIGTAVIPTLVASLAFVPRHLLPQAQVDSEVAVGVAVAPSGRFASREIPDVPDEIYAGALEEFDLEQEEEEEVGEEG